MTSYRMLGIMELSLSIVETILMSKMDRRYIREMSI